MRTKKLVAAVDPLVAGLVGALLACSAWGQGITSVEGKKFFERYVALGEAYDVAVADLYLDNSRIVSLRLYPTGQQKTLEMTGAQWKQLIRGAMPLAKLKGDRSEYKNVRLESARSVVRVRADRYSVLKCYWDKNYHMVIQRQSDGSLRIVEEYAETQPQSDC